MPYRVWQPIGAKILALPSALPYRVWQHCILYLTPSSRANYRGKARNPLFYLASRFRIRQIVTSESSKRHDEPTGPAAPRHGREGPDRRRSQGARYYPLVGFLGGHASIVCHWTQNFVQRSLLLDRKVAILRYRVQKTPDYGHTTVPN